MNKKMIGLVFIPLLLLILAGCQSKPSNYGAFFINGSDYVEIPVLKGPPGPGANIGLSAPDNRPSIYLYAQDTKLDYLAFQDMETNIGVEYQIKPAGNGAFELNPTNDLPDGTYCLAQDDPARQPADLPYWCFTVEGSHPAPTSTQANTRSPQPATPEQAAAQPYFEKYMAALAVKNISNVEYMTGKNDGNNATVIVSYDIHLDDPGAGQPADLPGNQLLIKTQLADDKWSVNEAGIESVLGPAARTTLQVASVNDEKISAGEFQTQVKIRRIQSINRYMQIMQYAQMFGVQDPLTDANFGPLLQQDAQLLAATDTMGAQVIELLVMDRLIRQEAVRRNITVSPDELEKAIQESFNYFANGTPTPRAFPTEMPMPTLDPTQLALVTHTPVPSRTPTATIAPLLTPAGTPTIQPTATLVSQQGFQAMFKLRKEGLLKDTGMDDAGYKRYVEISLLSTRLFEAVTGDMTPIVEQVWARHILVKTIEEADAVEARLANGEDFSKIAAEVSTDTGSKDKGGDVGWFGLGVMMTPFEDAAFAEKIGGISQPVQSDFGYHIIQVLGHEERPLAAEAFQQLRQSTYNEFLNALRDSATVQIYDLWKVIVPTEPALPPAQGK